MLRDELLRSKNDEIANCLLSRKRKLTELLYATVGFEAATGDSLYDRKEQAFLDANDITQGRYFDESSLPLPTTARINSSTKNFVASPVDNQTKSDLPASIQSSSESAAPAVARIEATQPGSTTGVQPVAVPHGVASSFDDTVNVKKSTSDTRSSKTSQFSNGSAPTLSSTQSIEQNPGVLAPESPLITKNRDGAETKVSFSVAQIAATASPPLEASNHTLPHKKPESRPSISIGSNHEQPLSPASSIDPYSNNTPAPVTASPATSPGEEATDLAKSGRTSPKHDQPMKLRPGLVPSTPGEQLQMEAARSLQKDDDRAVSSPNQGIKTRLEPASDTDLMEIDSKPDAVSSGDLHVDGKAANEPTSLSPTERLPNGEGAQLTRDFAVETSAAKSIPTIPVQPGTSHPERMTTRVSSGAIRHKSVSEILGETPKTPHERNHANDHDTPDSVARMRFKDRKEREKERTRLSTVVFPKQTPSQQDKADAMGLIHRESVDAIAKLNEEHDYLFTLFLNRAYAPPRGSNLSTLLASAHKTLSTANHSLEHQEQMDCRTLRRIYALQNANRWPLRQLKRSTEPVRQGTHWDVVLDHVKWMRTDFREERKWKIAAAKSCADWCAEYTNSDDEHRALLRVHAKIPALNSTQNDSKMNPVSPTEDASFDISHPTPDLVHSAEDESISDIYHEEPQHVACDTVAPAAIFSLGMDEFNFSINMTTAAEKILDELPLYEPIGMCAETQLPAFKEAIDSTWKKDLLPVSKFSTAKINFLDGERPYKRSRYDYTQYESHSEQRVAEITPEQTNVALFRPENKHIRDRIHPGHQFRPPTEHPMPSIGFFESRQSSQWTMSEDDDLRRLVKEYSYNWSLISSCLTSSSLYGSGAERRTPWECFERWVGLEGLPAEMSKTQYFRAYHQRLEAAQRTVLAQQQAAQQQQQQQQANSGQPQPPVRRRTTQPLRVDRRRSSRHLAILDSMRKLAKKRETMLQKQQHASHLASLRKANEANQPKPPITTPAEFSRLKYDREIKMQERQEQYRQQMIAQQRANLAAQRTGQLANQQQLLNVQNRNPSNLLPNSTTPGLPNATTNGAVPVAMTPGVGASQVRTQPLQGVPATNAAVNGQLAPSAMAMNMIPQSQMQQTGGARPGMPMQASPDSTRVVREATRLQEQQRLLQSRKQGLPQQGQSQQQFHNQQFTQQGSPNLNMTNVNGTPNNPALMAAIQAQGNMQSPSFHGNTPQGVSTPSPRMAQPNPLSNGGVPTTITAFQNQIQRANPNLPADQVNKLATKQLSQYQQQRASQQAAINAAAGGMSNMNNVQANYQVAHDGNFQTPQQSGMVNGNQAMQVPPNQGFSPMMRVPQSNQQNRMAPTSSPAMNGSISQPSRSATPQTQRSGSAQAGAVQGSSKSPHPPPAQLANS